MVKMVTQRETQILKKLQREFIKTGNLKFNRGHGLREDPGGEVVMGRIRRPGVHARVGGKCSEKNLLQVLHVGSTI